VQKRILIVEDDRTLARVIRDNLHLEGFAVHAVIDSSAALNYLRSTVPDLILLDLMLPGGDGFDLCRTLRQRSKVPIVILSARGQKADKLRGLNLGADDYITKPFDLEELLARIRAVLRRGHPAALDRLMIGRLVIDFRARRATSGTTPVHLTLREFEVLSYLAERHDSVVRRSTLLTEIWGYVDESVATRSVDHAIARLRKKIEPDPSHPQFILTAHGDGYCLCMNEDPEDLRTSVTPL
jgi:two-component system, OmpR family, response regulator VicR